MIWIIACLLLALGAALPGLPCCHDQYRDLRQLQDAARAFEDVFGTHRIGFESRPAAIAPGSSRHRSTMMIPVFG
ncbi:hypothetical protein DX980_23270 [Burkholderia gladioli]|nr:hypothetical protein C3Y08_27085 [Burkholderia gladioli]WAG22198.1 hypothetical protein DX980_23270 [Burkholderia gladioli]